QEVGVTVHDQRTPLTFPLFPALLCGKDGFRYRTSVVGRAATKAGVEPDSDLQHTLRDIAWTGAHAATRRFWRSAIMKPRTCASVSGHTLPGLPRLPVWRRRSNSRPLPTALQNWASDMPVSARKLSISVRRGVLMPQHIARFSG